MLELKVQCDCGQKYKFEVEPVNGQMPFRVSCPACGVDGTAKANALLQAQAPALAFAPAASPIPSGLRLGVAPPPVAAAPPPAPMGQRFPAAAGMPGRQMAAPPALPKAAGASNNLALGIVGALLGAAIGAGLMYGFFKMTDFRFPLMGTGVGALTGLGARILYRGTDTALGAISAVFAAVAVVGTLYVMYGEFPIFNILSVVVSISIAYKISA